MHILLKKSVFRYVFRRIFYVIQAYSFEKTKFLCFVSNRCIFNAAFIKLKITSELNTDQVESIPLVLLFCE